MAKSSIHLTVFILNLLYSLFLGFALIKVTRDATANLPLIFDISNASIRWGNLGRERSSCNFLSDFGM